MDFGPFSSYNQEEDRIIEPGLTHVTVYKTNNNKKKKNKKKKEKKKVIRLPAQTTDYKKEPIIDPAIQDEGELPPYLIVVHGPPKVITNNRRRIQFVECPNNVNGMIDAAKYADAVIFLIDTRFGFEMETFEFLNILKVHGIMKIMGVLTYLDGFKNPQILAKTKQNLKDHFHSEICEAAEVFCLPFLNNEMYSMQEIRELASFISDMDFHRLSWRATQPYVLVKHFEDVTPQDMQKDSKCNRNIVLEGYLRGCNVKRGTKVHIAGVGDFRLFGIASSSDPFPLLDTREERFEMEGLRTGTYLKLEIRGVPSEMVENLYRPILVGFIGDEEKAGYMQVTLMRHSWHSKLLKTKDPIIVSIGWRRYQTKPTYMEYYHGRLEMLSYTPKDEQCIAMFWGPLAPPSTGVVVVQNMADHEAPFRVLATGAVHDNNQAAKVLKQLLRTSFNICKKTAPTKSGLRKKIKKAADKELDGLKLRKHTSRDRDMTFTWVWKQVKVPRVYQPLMTALKPRDRIWRYRGPADGMSELPESVKKRFENMRAKGVPELTKDEKERTLKRLEEENADVSRDDQGVGYRKPLERRRAVIVVEGEPKARPFEFEARAFFGSEGLVTASHISF
ncbi:hypothetical protein MKW94_018963 [Papaver nudicaule]|uniref:Uncharacterized protein n=1 Tax=Papaver nudicaule TaxID=74823 RepID=A0AA41S2D2_PAPNU|nr:hypothetical protein [Papaver nudicaule]